MGGLLRWNDLPVVPPSEGGRSWMPSRLYARGARLAVPLRFGFVISVGF